MKNKILILVSLILVSFIGFSQPTNDNCVNAISLTANGPLLCNQTTNNATTQTGEHCAGSGGGITPKTVWYSFVATNSNMVLNVLRTNSINCFGYLSVYGPNPTCLPTAGNAILSCVLMNGDPGVYPNLTGLIVGATYFINYNGQGCGGSNDNFHVFCIGIYDVATNNTAITSSLIDECGTTFNGTTQGGYSATGSGTGKNDFDNILGNDVPWVGNNDSWFSFCVSSTSTYNITFNVGNCIFTSPNAGGQLSLLRGSPTTGFTNIGNSTNPTPPSGSWTSPNFTLNAGECLYLVVDGFAGDACNYSYILNVVSGGCVLLPIDLLSFTGENIDDTNVLNWVTASEINNDEFRIEHSSDTQNWKTIGYVDGNNAPSMYEFKDADYRNIVNYYRLTQIDFDGAEHYQGTIAIDNTIKGKEIIGIYNILGQKVDDNYKGIILIKYSNNTIIKSYR